MVRSGGLRYHFTDDWYIAAPPAATRDLIRHVEGWPTWWPSSLSVVSVPPRVAGATEASRYTFRTRLPYTMTFQADVVQDDPMKVETIVVGRVQGVGAWSVTPMADGSRVHFDWSVDPQLPWMRALSLLARPVFIWNHQALMAEGARGFADRLGVEMLRPPGCTPSWGVAVRQLVIGMALVGGAMLATRQIRHRAGLVPTTGPCPRGVPTSGRPGSEGITRAAGNVSAGRVVVDSAG